MNSLPILTWARSFNQTLLKVGDFASCLVFVMAGVWGETYDKGVEYLG